MQINVTATVADPSLPGVWTKNTLWPAGPAIKVEVADADDDPPCDKRTAATPGITAFDGYQIGRKTLATLRQTPGLVVSGADQTNAIEATAQLAEANARHAAAAEAMQATIVELRAEVARLRPLEARNAEAEQTIADLRARSAKSSQPSAPKQQEQRR